MIVATVVIFEILGILSAIHSIMSTRTPQGTIAWAVSLIALPYVSVPAYWVFGRDKFRGYVLTRQNELELSMTSFDRQMIRLLLLLLLMTGEAESSLEPKSWREFR